MTHSTSSGADPAWVAMLRRVGETDPDAVRAYIDHLIAEHSRPDLLAMTDAEFWPYARRRLHTLLLRRNL